MLLKGMLKVVKLDRWLKSNSKLANEIYQPVYTAHNASAVSTKVYLDC